jgi:hypothetical protein
VWQKRISKAAGLGNGSEAGNSSTKAWKSIHGATRCGDEERVNIVASDYAAQNIG